MNTKNTRYIVKIFTLDRFFEGTGFISWQNNLAEFLEEEEKHYGLKIISANPEIFIKIEYSNIIWEYKILFGSYKKKYKPLETNDDRWSIIEKGIIADLKTIGLSHLLPEILAALKKKEYFTYDETTSMQFKRYCLF